MARLMDELWTAWLGTVDYARGARAAGAPAGGAPGRAHPRRAAAARAPAGLHARRAARPPRDLPTRRGLVRRAGHRRSSTPTAAASSPTTARASSSATRSCDAGRVLPFVRTLERAIVAALADQGVAAHARDDESARVRRRVGRGPQDRLDRHPGEGRDHEARPRDQRRQRPRAVRVGRRLRPGRRDDDVGGARGGRRCAATRWAACARTSRTGSRRSSGCASGSCRPARLARAARQLVHPGLTASVPPSRAPADHRGAMPTARCSPGAWPSSSRGRSVVLPARARHAAAALTLTRGAVVVQTGRRAFLTLAHRPASRSRSDRGGLQARRVLAPRAASRGAPRPRSPRRARSPSLARPPATAARHACCCAAAAHRGPGRSRHWPSSPRSTRSANLWPAAASAPAGRSPERRRRATGASSPDASGCVSAAR